VRILLSIIVLLLAACGDDGPIVRPTPTATPTATHSVTATVTLTATPSATASTTATITLTPTASSTATPTATPSITLTATPSIEPIFPADYRDTYVEVRGCRSSIEHGGVSIRVFASPGAATPYLQDQNPFPEGSVLVKEEFDAPDCSNDVDLVRWRAARKEAPGFDPEDADWHWQFVLADRTVADDTKTTCTTSSCHREPPCLARDYMCTEGTAPFRVVLSRLPSALLSVAGRAGDDVYAVGADPDLGFGPLVLHYDGTAWNRLDTSATGDLWWISVAPIDGAFYLAGEGGLILQYDLAAETFTRHTTPGDELLFGIWGAAANDLWAVGGDLDDEDRGGVIWRFDGSTWTAQDLSGVRPEGIPTLFKVWGRAADDVYAVGRLGVILHFDGTAWSQVPSGSIRPLFTVHGDATRTAAVGGFVDGVILEQGGAAFANVARPGTPQMNGVFFPARGAPIAVGVETAVAARAAGGWEVQETGLSEQFPRPRDFHATWIDPEGGIWAVGGELVELTDGVLVYAGARTIGTTIESGASRLRHLRRAHP
jgi:hypothetical protein